MKEIYSTYFNCKNKEHLVEGTNKIMLFMYFNKFIIFYIMMLKNLDIIELKALQVKK